MKLVGKLKNLKIALKKWSEEIFGWVENNIGDQKTRLVMLEEQLLRVYVKEFEEYFLITKCELII